jgi:uncharacterized membrane protein
MNVVLRWVLSVVLVLTGTMHLVQPWRFTKIMPPALPGPLFWVLFTGVCELAGAVGLQVPALRQAAAWCLVIFFIAVFPANIYMALHPAETLGKATIAGMNVGTATLLRLPLQIPLIVWAWWYTRPDQI